MAAGNQPPADDITLRDVIDHMNHKFSLIEAKMGALDGKMDAHDASELADKVWTIKEFVENAANC
jgi:hypothetical protein